MPAHKGMIRATPHGPDRPDDWRDRAECLAEAMADPHIVGVWGGLDEQQRARLHKERNTPTVPKEIKHGTPGGARTHRKRGEEPCDRCTAAAKASNARDNQRKTEKRRIERAIA